MRESWWAQVAGTGVGEGCGCGILHMAMWTEGWPCSFATRPRYPQDDRLPGCSCVNMSKGMYVCVCVHVCVVIHTQVCVYMCVQVFACV